MMFSGNVDNAPRIRWIHFANKTMIMIIILLSDSVQPCWSFRWSVTPRWHLNTFALQNLVVAFEMKAVGVMFPLQEAWRARHSVWPAHGHPGAAIDADVRWRLVTLPLVRGPFSGHVVAFSPLAGNSEGVLLHFNTMQALSVELLVEEHQLNRVWSPVIHFYNTVCCVADQIVPFQL